MGIQQSSSDRFSSCYADGSACGAPDWPLIRAVAVTPSSTTDLAFPTRAVWVGGAGNLVVDMVDGGTGIVYAGIQAGTRLDIRVKRIYASSTATLIVAMD